MRKEGEEKTDYPRTIEIFIWSYKCVLWVLKTEGKEWKRGNTWRDNGRAFSKIKI